MKKLLLLLLAINISWSYAQTATGTTVNVDCKGNSTGSIDITVTGGTEPYTYNWEGPNDYTSSDSDIVNLVAGEYFLTVTEDGGGTDEKSFTITEPTELTVSLVSAYDTICSNDRNGWIKVAADGGTPGYSFNWTAEEDTYFSGTSDSIFDLAVDSYTLYVSDDNDCTTSLNVPITAFPQMVLNLTSHNLSCSGANDGSIDLSFLTESVPPYTFLWSNGDTTQSISGLSAEGEGGGYEWYSVTVTDANNCQTFQGQEVFSAEPLMFYLDITNSSCGGANGSAKIGEIEGGSGNYEINWVTGESGVDSISNLTAGVYSVEIQDVDSGCSTIQYFNIENNSNMDITPNVTDASSFYTNDGEINLDIDGDAPFLVLWSDSAIGQTKTDLYAGSYSTTVTDRNGCVNMICVNVSAYSELYGSRYSYKTSSCGEADGKAIISVSGGVPPYEYTWDDPSHQTSYQATNLKAGLYHCTVKDAVAHQKVFSIAVGDDNGPSISYVKDQSTACGLHQAFSKVNVEGGTEPYTYLWNNGATTKNLMGVEAGKYSLWVKDDAGCSAAYNTEIYPQQLSIPKICIVTVDSVTKHNLVVWEPQMGNIDHYNVYKEGCDGQFALIGTVDGDAITVFEDVTSFPFLRSYSYKISFVDDCGEESPLSSRHKTIHLEINLNEAAGKAQLIWDDYIGFQNPTFKIFKKTIQDGWTLLVELENTEFSFIDEGFNDNTLSYAIVVEKPGGEANACDAWNGNRASGGPYYQSSSNIEDEGIIDHTNIKNINTTELLVYPNPANEVLNINNPERINTIKIFDISGKLIVSYQNINQKELRLNTHNFDAGIYILQIESTSKIAKQRIVIE